MAAPAAGSGPAVSASSTNPVQQPEELATIVDEQNNVVGSATRKEMRSRNLPHRASFVFLHNSAGLLFVQQRVAWKETYPSHHDPAPGGVVGAGESYEENAAREVEEEMGVAGAALTPLFDFFFQDGVTRVWGRAFRTTYDGPLRLQPEEVAGGEWMAMAHAAKLVDQGPVCPDSAAAFREYVKRIAAGEVTPP